MEEEKILKDLEARLKEHDWYYMLSDDQEKYLAGKKSGMGIRDLMNKAHEIDRQKTWDLYSKYCPYHVKKEG